MSSAVIACKGRPSLLLGLIVVQRFAALSCTVAAVMCICIKKVDYS